MGKTCYRFFGGRIAAQERWLNEMAAAGWRLVRCGKLAYEFEAAAPGQVQYAVEYIGHRSRESAQDYRAFLEELGCRVWYKNINLRWSVGKVEARPWAERGGRLASHATTLDRELIIVEKENDGKPFALHTTYEDRMELCRVGARSWLWPALLFGGLGLLSRMGALVAVGLLALAPALLYGLELRQLKRESRVREWDAASPARRTQGKGAAVLCVALCAALALGAVVLLPGQGSLRSISGSRIGWSEQTAGNSWAAHYAYFNGRCAKKLPTGGGAAVLRIESTTEKGTLTLTVENAQGDELLRQVLSTGVLEVAVDGPVTVRLEAAGHTGEFRLEW